MQPVESLHVSDPAVVARFLQLRALIHDRLLTRIEQLIASRYVVRHARSVPSTLTSHVRAGFDRPGEGQLWPVVFTTTVDISVALCVELANISSLGTTVNGPQMVRHRNWEDWWGWERPIGQLHPDFFNLPAAQQEDVIAAWYTEKLEWLAGNGLLRRKG